MNDLVERLNNDVSLFSNMDWREHVALAREAATEIARLRALNAELVDALGEAAVVIFMSERPEEYGSEVNSVLDAKCARIASALSRAKGEA